MEIGSRKRRVAIKAGVRLKELRLSLGFSQGLMAEKAGCDESYLDSCEKGKYEPTVHFLCSLCKKFNVNPGWLVDGKKHLSMYIESKSPSLAGTSTAISASGVEMYPNVNIRLEELRTKLGITRKLVGELTGRSKCAVYKYEKGVTKPSIVWLNKVCTEFDVNPKWLIDGEMDQTMFTGAKGLALEQEGKKKLEEKIIVSDACPRLKALREKLGFPRSKMAKMCSCSHSYIGSCERGSSEPSVKHLRKICDKLGVNTKWLIDGQMDQPMFIGSNDVNEPVNSEATTKVDLSQKLSRNRKKCKCISLKKNR